MVVVIMVLGGGVCVCNTGSNCGGVVGWCCWVCGRGISGDGIENLCWHLYILVTFCLK